MLRGDPRRVHPSVITSHPFDHRAAVLLGLTFDVQPHLAEGTLVNLLHTTMRDAKIITDGTKRLEITALDAVAEHLLQPLLLQFLAAAILLVLPLGLRAVARFHWKESFVIP